MQARLNSNGLLSDSIGFPAIQRKDGFRLIRSAGVWMSAKDSLGQLRLAAHNVLFNTHEFWSGPLELQNEIASNQATWNKVYPITREGIDYHLKHYTDNSYVPSQSILTWPGSLGTPFAQILAPFVDYQVNNLEYEPLEGDYPYITSDELIYSIANDRYSSNHQYTNSLPLGVELHTSLFGFEKDTTLENCVIVRYSVYNRSNRAYKNFRFTAAINFELGNNTNEYLGTETTAQALYVINDTTEATFSGKLVSSGCMAINRQISSTMYFENTSDPINGRPDSAIHFYNLMQGNWKNGQALNYGSNGVDGSGSARFVYPDTTDKDNSNFRWVDQVPGKKIGLLNFDSIELKQGQAVNFEMVYFSVEEKFDNLKQIGQYCSTVKQALKARKLVKLVENQVSKSHNLICFPNPAK
ncbi:MAG: hypothetical protein R2852_09950, partial [Bacteroidia bacterium]